VSEKSTRNDLDYAAKHNIVCHHSAFWLQMQLWPCKTAHELYNPRDSEFIKEIPGTTEFLV
jgi:hypothetical protein